MRGNDLVVRPVDLHQPLEHLRHVVRAGTDLRIEGRRLDIHIAEDLLVREVRGLRRLRGCRDRRTGRCRARRARRCRTGGAVTPSVCGTFVAVGAGPVVAATAEAAALVAAGAVVAVGAAVVPPHAASAAAAVPAADRARNLRREYARAVSFVPSSTSNLL